MNPFFLLLFIGHMSTLPAFAQETAPSPRIMGPPTMDQPVYPNSGRSPRTNDVTGRDMATASQDASPGSQGTQTSGSVPQQKQEEQDPSFQPGPYDRNGVYQIEKKAKSGP